MAVYISHQHVRQILDLLVHVDSHLIQILQRMDKMAGELDRLTTEVGETKTVVDSAIKLLDSLAELIRNNAGNPTALNALADDLDAKQKELADAITRNTPSAPA